MSRRIVELPLASLSGFIGSLVCDADHAINGTDNYDIGLVYQLFNGLGGSHPRCYRVGIVNPLIVAEGSQGLPARVVGATLEEG